MRPSFLNPLFAGAASIKGIGAKIDKIMGYQAPGPFRNVLVFVHERRYDRK